MHKTHAAYLRQIGGLNADPDFINKTAPDANNPSGTNPKAYLTVVFFNERFEYVGEGSMTVRVGASADGQAPLVIPNVKAPKNGYAYIYLSNESDEPVYFDDFKVADTRGRIIEENHYYPPGLKIAGISSVKMGDANEGSLKNNNLYNDKELFDDADLDWYDYGFRNYDPQIGRFTQLDPLTDDYPDLTPYQYASNDPILNIDIDGLEGGSSVIGHVGDAVVTSKSFMPNIAVQGLSKAAVAQKTLTAFNIGINSFKLPSDVVDNTRVNTLVNSQNMSKIQSDSYLASIFRKMGSWLDRVSHGSGSYQHYGILFTGSNNGTMEFRDHAGTILDHIDIGPLFGAFKAAGLDPKVFKELFESSGGIKYLGNLNPRARCKNTQTYTR